MDGWKYENLGLVSDCPPHITPNIDFLCDGWPLVDVGKAKKKPLYIKWTDQFDCGHETEWWYLVKDDEFDISKLKSKRRYEINKGNKYFDVKQIDPKIFLNDINRIRVALFSQYPEEYRKENNEEKTNNMYRVVQNNDKWITVGAFSRESGQLCGYADINILEGYIDFVRMCVDPSFERDGINFALVNGVLESAKPLINKGYYICDGQRSIRHKTEFQNWLVKYFDFRFAYCRLNIRYSKLGLFVYKVGKTISGILMKSKSKWAYKLLVYVKLGEIAETFR